MAGSFATAFQPGWLMGEVTVEPWTGSFDNQGQPLYGSAVVYKCHIEEQIRMVRDTNGNERASNARVFVVGGPFDAHDKFTLPASFRGPRVQAAITVSNVHDRNEYSHAEVYL